jgi:hypothetical protein
VKHTITFFYSAVFAILGSIFLLSGVAVWTAIIHNAQGLSHLDITLENTSVQLSLQFAAGHGLYLTWTAFACLSMSIVPYMLRYVLYFLLLHIIRAMVLHQLLHLPRMSNGNSLMFAMLVPRQQWSQHRAETSHLESAMYG